MGFIVLYLALDELKLTLRLFLEFPNKDAYETLVWKYSGPLNLAKNLFKGRNDLFYLDYDVLWAFVIWVLMFLGLLVADKYSGRAEKWFTSGKHRQRYKQITKTLTTPSFPAFIASVALYFFLLFSFANDTRHSYEIGVNRRLAEAINERAARRADEIVVNSVSRSRAMVKDSLGLVSCTFYLAPKKAQIFNVTLLDFLFSAVVGDSIAPIEKYERFKKLPTDIDVILDPDTFRDVQLDLKKGNYTKEEVEDLLRRDRENNELKQAIRKRPKLKDFFLLVNMERAMRLFLIGKSDDETALGPVEMQCSSNPRDLQSFHLNKLLSWGE